MEIAAADQPLSMITKMKVGRGGRRMYQIPRWRLCKRYRVLPPSAEGHSVLMSDPVNLNRVRLRARPE